MLSQSEPWKAKTMSHKLSRKEQLIGFGVVMPLVVLGVVFWDPFGVGKQSPLAIGPFLVLGGYAGLCSLVGLAASKHGRNGYAYTTLGLLLSPVLAYVILLIAGENRTPPPSANPSG